MTDRKFQIESCCSREAEQFQTMHPFRDSFQWCTCLLLKAETEHKHKATQNLGQNSRTALKRGMTISQSQGEVKK